MLSRHTRKIVSYDSLSPSVVFRVFFVSLFLVTLYIYAQDVVNEEIPAPDVPAPETVSVPDVSSSSTPSDENLASPPSEPPIDNTTSTPIT